MDYRKLLELPQRGFRLIVNHHLGWLGVAACLPLFGVATAFAVAPGSKAATPEIVIQTVTERLALPQFSSSTSQTRYWRDQDVRRGDSISRVLNRLGIRDSEAARALHNTTISRDLLKLKAGATLSVQTNDDGELFGLRFLNDDENGEKVLVALDKVNDEWQLSADPVISQTISTLRKIPISGGLAASLRRADLPKDIRNQMASIFADRFALSSLQQGDSIDLVYETLLYNGSPIATGSILAMEVRKAGVAHRAFYFAHDSESGAYYDEHGQAIKKGFSHQPVEKYRISSGFGTRYHPILRSIRMHEGVDYAAVAGTPIVAPADGKITKAGWQGGYGKAVEIQHGDKLSTLYAHMQGFAKGITAGRSIKAGEVIGYVGSTGRSTGAHLHFEVRMDGQPVNPATAALPTPALTASQQQQFAKQSSVLTANLQLLAPLPLTTAALD